jgi:glycine dehydrogenase
MSALEGTDGFGRRLIGPSPDERARMLEVVGVASLDALVDEAIPASIRLRAPLHLPPAEGEHQFLTRLERLAHRNRQFRSYIGLGYHDTVTPAVIQRMVLENPGWYTPYTPYQAEIAQGRLTSLLNFQTMVVDLTGMDVANASLLDEATAAAEAMTLMRRVYEGRKDRGSAVRCLVSDRCLPQTIAVLQSRAEPLGISLEIGPIDELDPLGAFGLVLQYPDALGELRDLRSLVDRAHEVGALVAVGADLLALALVTPPGEMGADVVYGSAQRFGVPLGFGGPHAAYFATRQAHTRQVPGRLIGMSVDANGRPAARMALATREQHIRREKATSNVCTAQALLANMAAMYAVHHGPDGLRRIAARVHLLARVLEAELAELGHRQRNTHYFDTLRVDVPAGIETIQQRAVAAGLNLHYHDDRTVCIALDETAGPGDVRDIVDVFAGVAGRPPGPVDCEATAARLEAASPDALARPLRRTSAFLTHPVFNRYHSETALMRYIRGLEHQDIGLDRSMIPLGSCTMKLNPAAGMLPLSWSAFGRVHPFAPDDQAGGYAQILLELQSALCEIAGLAEVSFQPNSGAQGELTGLLVIRAYHRDRGQGERDVVLIPASAHGTNPASGVMAGLRVVVVATAGDGGVDVEDLRRKATQHGDRLACLMITYPSTHGVFEEEIEEICRIVHEHGGQVYLDGANMNAQVGLTSPGVIGADVCHFNLHKTFAIPHGGGGPGMGPIAVARHLAPYLPSHPLTGGGGERAIGAVAASPHGSASIMLVSYAYIRMLGAEGLAEASRHAILAANYVKARLEPHYPVLYARANGRVAHELIFDLRGFKAAGIDEMDVAKRLMDFGFHAPTVSFPVAGTLMVEPTESESQEEIDRFCDAMIRIREEIAAVESGAADRDDNVLTQAPHTAEAVTATAWSHPYTREEAAFPLPFVRARKFWPPVGRIDNARGDRHLFCVCPPVEEGA